MDLLTGEGWDAGPGVFDSKRLMAFAVSDTIHAVTYSGIHRTYHPNGALIDATRIESGLTMDGPRAIRPIGVLSGGRLVSHYIEHGDYDGPEYQRVAQGFIVTGDEVPIDSALARVYSDSRSRGTSTSGFLAAARGDLIVFSSPFRQRLVVLRDGQRSHFDIGWEAEALRIDADSRIWVRLHQVPNRGIDSAWIVFDSQGGELMSVDQSGVLDAKGDWLLTDEWGEDVFELVLHRRVR